MGDLHAWIGIVKYSGDNVPEITLVGDEDDGSFKELIERSVKIVKDMPTQEGDEIAITPIHISGNYVAFFPEDNDESIEDLVENYW